MKTLVIKLSGFAKFEVDTKITAEQLYDMIVKLSHAAPSPADGESQEAAGADQTTGEPVFNLDLFSEFVGYFEKALAENSPPFQGDLENEKYKLLLQNFREFQPPATE